MYEDLKKHIADLIIIEQKAKRECAQDGDREVANVKLGKLLAYESTLRWLDQEE